MKTSDSVKAITLAIIVICLLETIFGYAVFSIQNTTYKVENITLVENNVIPINEIKTPDIQKLGEVSTTYEIVTEIEVAEGVSLEEIQKQEIEARKNKIVYENMTLGELSEQLDKSLSSTLANKGYLFADYATSVGVDPYLAVAIALHETGCKWNCSNAVNSYNNVGGMMGSNGLLRFNTLDDGIKAFIDNLYRNYVSQGLTTPETIGGKYAASSTWSSQVNSYINEIKAAQAFIFLI